MNFRPYQHIERFGSEAVMDIEFGFAYIFPKIDGTNSSVWSDEENIICGGSRKRELSFESDNAGFYRAMMENDNIANYLIKHPTHRLFGEWLVPHSLKTYRDDAWRKFYIFDVCVDRGDGLEYLPYPAYKGMLDEFKLDYIMPLRIIKNASYEDLIRCLDENTFLIKDGNGVGEGIVIKNYDYYNKYGVQNWAKIVTSEFKEVHYKTMGAPETSHTLLEEKIIEKYLTSAFIEKEFAKLGFENGTFRSTNIPELLYLIYKELITEEMWNILVEFKNSKIDFKTLNHLAIRKIKEVKSDIFG